jgi:site-specific recombinase XerD
MNKYLRAVGREWGLNLSTHSFRKAVIGAMLSEGIPRVAQTVIGHRRLSTTLQYTAPPISPAEIRDMVERRTAFHTRL